MRVPENIPPKKHATDKKIVAICLLRNEEYYIHHVIENIKEFCDIIIVADNISTDRTFSILQSLAAKNRKIRLTVIQDRSKSQDLIKDFVGTPTWVFGVDGDEIYDPAGLMVLRKQILEGKFQNCTQLYGNVLNCSHLDKERKIAKGYLAPPCRSMTKLYNFELIEDWSDHGVERLHGEVIYKNGFSKSNAINLHEHYSWENSFFRCLHLCFLQRSSQDAKKTNDQPFARVSGVDLSQGGLRTKIKRWAYSLLKINEQSSWKLEKYQRGALVEKSVAEFFCSPGSSKI